MDKFITQSDGKAQRPNYTVVRRYPGPMLCSTGFAHNKEAADYSQKLKSLRERRGECVGCGQVPSKCACSTKTAAFNAGPAVPARLIREFAPVMDRRERLGQRETADVAAGEQQWFPSMLQTDATSIPSMMASPGRQALMAGSVGGLAGMGLGSLVGRAVGHEGLGSLAGAAVGGIPAAAYRYLGQRRRNDHLKEVMRRLPAGATKRDYDVEEMLSNAVSNRFKQSAAFLAPVNPALRKSKKLRTKLIDVADTEDSPAKNAFAKLALNWGTVESVGQRMPFIGGLFKSVPKIEQAGMEASHLVNPAAHAAETFAHMPTNAAASAGQMASRFEASAANAAREVPKFNIPQTPPVPIKNPMQAMGGQAAVAPSSVAPSFAAPLSGEIANGGRLGPYAGSYGTYSAHPGAATAGGILGGVAGNVAGQGNDPNAHWYDRNAIVGSLAGAAGGSMLGAYGRRGFVGASQGAQNLIRNPMAGAMAGGVYDQLGHATGLWNDDNNHNGLMLGAGLGGASAMPGLRRIPGINKAVGLADEFGQGAMVSSLNNLANPSWGKLPAVMGAGALKDVAQAAGRTGEYANASPWERLFGVGLKGKAMRAGQVAGGGLGIAELSQVSQQHSQQAQQAQAEIPKIDAAQKNFDQIMASGDPTRINTALGQIGAGSPQEAKQMLQSARDAAVQAASRAEQSQPGVGLGGTISNAYQLLSDPKAYRDKMINDPAMVDKLIKSPAVQAQLQQQTQGATKAIEDKFKAVINDPNSPELRPMMEHVRAEAAAGAESSMNQNLMQITQTQTPEEAKAKLTSLVSMGSKGGNMGGQIMNTIGGWADSLLGGMGLPVGQMSGMQKIVLLLGGLGLLGGLFSGSSGLGALGGLGLAAALAPIAAPGVVPNFWGGGQQQQAPQKPQPSFEPPTIAREDYSKPTLPGFVPAFNEGDEPEDTGGLPRFSNVRGFNSY